MSDIPEQNPEKRLHDVEAATFEWSKFFSTPTGKAIGTIIVAFGLFLASYFTEKMNPPQPPVVNIIPSNDAPPIVSNKTKFFVYVTEATKKVPMDASLAQFDLSIDVKVYDEGKAYKIGDTLIPLPCVVKMGSDGKAVSGVTFEKAADIAEFCKKGK